MSDGAEQPAYVFDEARRLRTPTAAAVAGIIFAVLFVTSAALIRSGFPTAPVRTLLTPAVERIDPGRVRVGLQLLPFAGIAFLWFIGVVRTRFGRHEDQLFATVFLGTGLLLVAILLVAAAIGAAVLDENVGRRAVDGSAVRIVVQHPLQPAVRHRPQARRRVRARHHQRHDACPGDPAGSASSGSWSA